MRSPYIYMKAAEKDPAWKAAEREDRVPADYINLPQPAKVS